MNQKVNSRFIFLIVLLLLLVTSIIIYNLYKTEKEKYESRNDFARASTIMTLSYNKEFSLFYPTLRIVQSLTTEPKLSKEELILDFAKSDMIPILKFLQKENESESLVNAFERLGIFISDYNYITIKERENIFIRQENGEYYNEKDGYYEYYTAKKVISKQGFNQLYFEYLQSINYNDVLDYIADKLYDIKKINSQYSLKEIKNLIYNSDFYEEYESDIVEIISDDLIDFCEYVSENYFYEDSSKTLSYELKKDIDFEEITISFKMKKHDRIYSSVSKYETYNYTLDLEDVFSQIKNLGYPLIYF